MNTILSTGREAMRQQLIDHEGLRLKVYTDTVGKLTIGVGRNLDDVGISHAEAMALLDHDIEACVTDLVSRYPWFEGLDGIRQRAVCDVRFNLGPHRFDGFKQTLAALARGDFERAADALTDSKWYGQVGRRGPRIVHMVRTGTVPEGS